MASALFGPEPGPLYAAPALALYLNPAVHRGASVVCTVDGIDFVPRTVRFGSGALRFSVLAVDYPVLGMEGPGDSGPRPYLGWPAGVDLTGYNARLPTDAEVERYEAALPSLVRAAVATGHTDSELAELARVIDDAMGRPWRESVWPDAPRPTRSPAPLILALGKPPPPAEGFSAPADARVAAARTPRGVGRPGPHGHR